MAFYTPPASRAITFEGLFSQSWCLLYLRICLLDLRCQTKGFGAGSAIEVAMLHGGVVFLWQFMRGGGEDGGGGLIFHSPRGCGCGCGCALARMWSNSV